MKPADIASEDLIRLMQVVAGDKDLLQWFLAMEKLPENLRYSHVRGMAERMRADGIDPDLLGALKSLASPEVYMAFVKTVRELSR